MLFRMLFLRRRLRAEGVGILAVGLAISLTIFCGVVVEFGVVSVAQPKSDDGSGHSSEVMM